LPSKLNPDGSVVPGTTWVPETLYQKRLRLIARWRHRRLIDYLGRFEPGKTPYGVRT